MVKCIHCGGATVVAPEDPRFPDEASHDVPVCLDCEKYQVENGTELLGRSFPL